MVKRRIIYITAINIMVTLSVLLNPLSTVSAVSLKIDKNSNNIEFYDERATGLICSIDQSSGSGDLAGEDNLQKTFNYFLAKGVSKKVAAAIVGNISQESKGNPLLLQGGGQTTDPSGVGLYKDGSMFENKPGQTSLGKAWGLLQWDPGNAALYWQKRAGVSGNIAELSTQLAITWWHLNNYAPTSKKNVLAEMEATVRFPAGMAGAERARWEEGALERATEIMVRKFFGAGKPMLSNRVAAAAKAMSYPVSPLQNGTLALDTGVADPCTGASMGPISEGGLTDAQAKQFMIYYGTNKNNSTKNQMISSSWTACGGTSKGGGSNCVSFVEFFLNKFTNIKARAGGNMGNGDKVVDNLRNKGVPTGTEPKVGAIFSISGGTYGHTGVVLGIQGDTVIVGHASCERGKNGKRGPGDGTESGNGSGFIRVGKRSDKMPWWGGSVAKSFAYPEVNMDAINKYLQTGE